MTAIAPAQPLRRGFNIIDEALLHVLAIQSARNRRQYFKGDDSRPTQKSSPRPDKTGVQRNRHGGTPDGLVQMAHARFIRGGLTHYAACALGEYDDLLAASACGDGALDHAVESRLAGTALDRNASQPQQRPAEKRDPSQF